MRKYDSFREWDVIMLFHFHTDRAGQFENAVVMTTSAAGNTVDQCGRHDGVLNALWTNITCASPPLGRWVQIILFYEDEGSLQLLEIEVVGY